MWLSTGAAGHAHDAGNRANTADDLRELATVAHLEPKRKRGGIAFAVDTHVLDVRMRCGDPTRDLREQAHAVERAHENLRLELAFDAARPVDGDPLRGLLAVLDDVPAAIAM